MTSKAVEDIWDYTFENWFENQADIAEPILKTQKSLNQLKISTLWSVRILFLQLPVWTTFWWNESMLSEWNRLQWSVSGIITLLFFLIAGWLFFNIRYENRNKKWFRFVLNGKEWTPLIRSMELLEQVETYQTKQK